MIPKLQKRATLDDVEQPMPKTPEELKLRRVQEKLDGVQAMVEYKKAEGTAREHLARLRTERATREASGVGKAVMSKAKPARKTKQPKSPLA